MKGMGRYDLPFCPSESGQVGARRRNQVARVSASNSAQFILWRRGGFHLRQLGYARIRGHRLFGRSCAKFHKKAKSKRDREMHPPKTGNELERLIWIMSLFLSGEDGDLPKGNASIGKKRKFGVSFDHRCT